MSIICGPQTTVNKAAMNSLTPTTKRHHPGLYVANEIDDKHCTQVTFFHVWKSIHNLLSLCLFMLIEQTPICIAHFKSHICRWILSSDPGADLWWSSLWYFIGSNEHFDTTQCTWLEVCNVSHSPVYVYNILSLTTMDKPRGTKACGISLLN